MVKRARETGSDNDDGSETPTTSHNNTVFVDTNLDTHLVMIVSDDETVADFRKKIMLEHPQCFPKIGEIEIHALKVKRKGYFYHLSDSMLVRSAFVGAKKNWFLSVDASRLRDPNDNINSCNPDAGKQLALLCITYPPGGRNDLPTGGPSNGISLINKPPMPQPVSFHHPNVRVDDADQSCEISSCKEVSKDFEMEVKHITDDHHEKSSSATDRLDLDMQEKYWLSNEENRVLRNNEKHKDGTSSDGIYETQCNNSLVGSSEKRPAAKKKHKIKSIGEKVCHPVLKEKYASSFSCSKDESHREVVGTTSGNARKEKLNDTTVGTENVGEEPFKNEKSENRTGDVQCNVSFEETSQSGLRTKKKRKREINEVSVTSLKQNIGLVSNNGEETSKRETVIPDNSKEDKQKSKNATLDSLSSKQPKDVHLMKSSSSVKTKRKVMNKSSTPHDQNISSVPLSLNSVGVSSCQENREINVKDLGRLSDATNISGEGDQLATLPKHLAVSCKVKQCESLQEEVEGNKDSSLVGTNMIDTGFGTVGDKNASKITAGAEIEEAKIIMKHSATYVKGTSSVSVRDYDQLKKDTMYSGPENIIPDDHNFEKYPTDKLEDERELSQNRAPGVLLSESCKHLNLGEADMTDKEANISSKLSDANIEMKSGSTRKKKRSRTKTSAGVDQVKSDMDHSDKPADDISSIVPRSASKDRPVDESKKEGSILSQSERAQVPEPNKLESSFGSAGRKVDDLCVNDAEPLSLTQINENKENEGNVEDIRKKPRKNQSSTTQTLLDLPVKERGNELEPMLLSEINRTEENAENVGEEVRQGTKRKKKSTAKSLRDLPMVAERKGDDVSGNEAEPLPLTQTNENKENGRNADEILRKKLKKIRSSTTKTLPDLSIKELGIEVEPMQRHETSRTQGSVENVDKEVRKETERSKSSTAKSLRDLPMVAEGKDDDVSGYEAELLPPSMRNENKETGGNSDEILRKKLKKNRSSTTKSLSDLPIKERGSEVDPMQQNETSRAQENAENVDEEVRKETERNKTSTAKRVRDLPMDAGGKGDDVKGNDAEPLQQLTEKLEIGGNADEMLRKKPKKNRTSSTKTLLDLRIKERGNEVVPMQLNESNKTQENVDVEVRKETKGSKNSSAKSLGDLPMKTQPVGVEELTSSKDIIGGEDTLSNTKKRTRSVKTSALNQSTGTDMGLARHSDTECAAFHPQLPPSEKLEGDSVRRPLEARVDDNALKNCIMDAADNQMSANCVGDTIKFKEYFVPARNQCEVAPEVLVEKVNDVKRSHNEVKSKKSIKKHVACGGTSPDPKNPPKSHENPGSEKKLKGGIASSIQLQGSSSIEKRSKVRPHPKSSGSDVKVLPPHNNYQIKSIHEVVRRADVTKAAGTNGAFSFLEENDESSTASISSSEIPQKHNKHQSSLDRHRTTTAEASRKNTGEVCEKRLLATPGAIFRDASSDSSEDENRPGNSDASTRTPSKDSSSSSGYSDGESQSSLDSLQNGSHGVKGKKNGGKQNITSVLSGPKNISMAMILRSSSRFKKAKLTASQSQLGDSESQPVDFVPDSQADL